MIIESTESELRETGISVIGEVRWGAHLCCFYETKEDLLETLVTYFRVGLENNEFCVWVVPSALSVDEAKHALGHAVPDLERHLAEGALEIHSHAEWYLRSGRWDPQRVLRSWRERLNQGLAGSYAGLRAAGDGGWVQSDDWMGFRAYEQQVNALIAEQRSIILCTYPLATSSGDQVFDVACSHQVAVARRNGNWEMIETPELKEAKAEIKRLNEKLEEKVEERTRELAASNEALRSEIAERKLAEAAVKQAEDRIRLVIDTIPTIALSLRPDGTVDFVNQRWMDYTGLSLAEEVAEPTRAMHPADRPRVMEKWLAAQAAGETHQDEVRLRRADGEYRWFLIRTAPLRDEQGNIVKWYGVSTDIEDRKQAEMQSRTLIDAIPQQIWSAPADGRTDYCNDRWRAYSGLKLEDLRGYGWKTMIHPEDRDRILKAWHEAVANGTPYEQEERHRGTDGKYRWFLALGVPMRNAEGHIVRWYGTNTDIEERKRAEEALRRSEKLFAAFMDHLPGFAWMKDIEGRYVFVNKKESELDVYRDGAIGKTDADLWPEEIASAYRANDQLVITTRKEVQAVEPSLANGEKSYMLVSKFPVFAQDGSVVMVAGAGVDITDLTQAKDALSAQALRYKTLMETSTDSIYVLDEKGDLQEANAAFLRRRGYTAAEVKGLNVADWDATRGREQLKERRRKLVNKSHVFESRHRCKDGSIFDVEVCATGVRIGGEQFVFCVTRDITERKQAAAALATRARHQALIAALGRLALVGGDLQWLFDQTVARIAETLGVEYCNVLELLPDGSALETIAGAGWKKGLVGEATVGVGRDSQAGYAMLTKDLVIVEDLRTETRFNGSALLREHGVISGMSVIIGDLEKPFGVMGAHTTAQRVFTADDTHFFQSMANVLAEAIQRKRAEAQAGQLAAIVESSTDAIVGMDLNGVITSWNRGAQKTFGYTAEEMVGGPIKRLIPPDRREEEEQVFSRIRRGENVEHFETAGIEKGGAQIDLSLAVSPIRNAAGEIAGASLVARDITGLKRTQDALRTSEERFRELAENIHEVFWMSDPENTRMIYISPAYEAIWGRSRETLYASPDSWMEAIHPEDKERMIRTRAGRAQALPHDNTYRIVRPDGSIRWIRDRGFPVRDERGAVVRFAGIAEDISERKQAEDRLRRSEEKFKTLFGIAPVGISLLDRQHNIVDANPALEQITRLRKEELLDGTYQPRAILHADGTPMPSHEFPSERAMAENRPVNDVEAGIVTENGETIWVQVSVAPLDLPDARAVVITQDITERKRAEEELKREKEILAKIFNDIPVMIGFVGADGGVKLVNPEWERTMGWTLKELEEQKVDIFTEAYPDLSYRQKVLDFVAAGTGDWADLKIKVRDGHAIDAACAVVRLSDGTKIAIAQDITERKRAAEALEAANHQLRILSRQLFHIQEEERRHLARELHDEIGQTLTAAKINLKIVAPEVPAQIAGRLNDSVELLDRLLSQVRQLSLDLHPSLLDDLGLVPALRSLLDQQAHRAGLRTQFFTAEPFENLGAETQIVGFRIAQEAITNVLRHAGAQQISVHLHTKAGRLEMKISDDGTGFDLAESERHAHEGLGFGLMGMRERAALVGGRVEIISSASAGTTVEVSLPLNGSGKAG